MTDQPPAKGQLIAGRVLSGLVILFLLFDAGLKLVSPETAIKYSPPDLGWPLDVGTMHMLVLLLLITTLLYIWPRSEKQTSELQSLMRISYAAFCLKKKNTQEQTPPNY